MIQTRIHRLRYAAAILSLFGSHQAWAQITTESDTLAPSDGSNWSSFNSDLLAMDGSFAVIKSGYLFDVTTGQQIIRLVPEADPIAGFGSSVAIDGDLVVVGNIFDDGKGFPEQDAGAVYLFDHTTRQEINKLVADDRSRLDRFGSSVGISGNLIVVGSPLNDAIVPNSGAAYVFDATTGQQLHKLVPDDGSLGDQFGDRVAISGSTILVGVPQDDDNGGSSGSVYVFDAITGQQLHKLVPADGSTSDLFGRSVALDGNIAVIGAHLDDDNGLESGAVYVYDTTTGQMLRKLLAEDGEADDQFGFAVSIDGTQAVIGAQKDTADGVRSGSAYVFDVNTGQQLMKLQASDGSANDFFGSAVAISDSNMLVGSPDAARSDGGIGSVYVFSLGSSCAPDLTGEGDLNFLDVSAFLSAFGMQDPIADFVYDGNFNFFDVSEFLAQFSAGCP